MNTHLIDAISRKKSNVFFWNPPPSSVSPTQIQPRGANIEPRGANIEPRGANIEFKNQNESTFDEKCELYDANKSKGVLFLFFFTLFIDSFLASSGLYRF